MTTTHNTQPLTTLDYPAAHSMDTTWFAVDEEGEVAIFDSGEEGIVPVLEGMKPFLDTDLHNPHPKSTIEFHERYEEVGKYISEVNWKSEKGGKFPGYSCEWILSEHVHQFETDMPQGFYYWTRSPEKPFRLQDLPISLQSPAHLLFMKDYVFRSREPIDPYEHATNCFTYNGFNSLFPMYSSGPSFPVPSRTIETRVRDYIDAASDEIDLGHLFIAEDDEGALAVFHTWRFGAVPRTLDPERNGRSMWYEIIQHENSPGFLFDETALLHEIDVRQLNSDSIPALQLPLCLMIDDQNEPAKFENRRGMSSLNSLRTGAGRFGLCLGSHTAALQYNELLRQGKICFAWRWGWAHHWLEHQFGLWSPRMHGFYYYDASGHLPLPYFRAGVPNRPATMAQMPEAIRKRFKPIRFEGVRFCDAKLVQPFEFTDCISKSEISNDISLGFKHGEWWIDSRFEAVHPCHEFAVKIDDDERMLRRAQRHIARLDDLWLPDPVTGSIGGT